jgi:regulator of sigma E protease
VTALQLVTAYLLPFLVLITSITFVHEMGHFAVGCWCGVRVDTFSLGLGPPLWTWIDRAGRRWQIGSLPIGGYVKFNEAAEKTTAPSTGSFSAQKLWRRAAIVMAGPIANLLFAVVIFTGYVIYYGVGVRPPIIGQVGPGTAAEAAGLEPGDLVVAIDGEDITDWRGIQQAIVSSHGNSLNIRIRRLSQDLTLLAVPRMSELDTLFGKVPVPFLGIGPSLDTRDVQIRYYGLFGSIWEGTKQVGSVVAETGAYFSGLLLGEESADQISGPIRMAKGSGEAARSGLDMLGYLAALLSISIGIVNLLPIPVLDGGRLIFFAIEALRGRPMSIKSQQLGFQLGSAFIVAVMVLTTCNDVRHLGGG